jgi:hypothetical protein
MGAGRLTAAEQPLVTDLKVSANDTHP